MANDQAIVFELHYFFKDPTQHHMDAQVRHSCENEILKLLSEISDVLDIPLDVNVLGHDEGGLKDFVLVVAKSPTFQAFIFALLGNLIADYATVDRELEELQREELRLSIEEKKYSIQKLKKEIQGGDPRILSNVEDDLLFILNNEYKPIRSRSDFYKQLYSYEPVIQISNRQLDAHFEQLTEPQIVQREDFEKFILYTDDIPPIINEKAEIEIIAPVIKEMKKGNYKWKGIFEGEAIDFYMTDKDFKEKVYTKEVSFSNGIALTCVLKFSQKMNELGEIYVSSYSVPTVVSYQDKESIVKTPQGKQYFIDKKAKENQMTIFDKL